MGMAPGGAYCYNDRHVLAYNCTCSGMVENIMRRHMIIQIIGLLESDLIGQVSPTSARMQYLSR
jgi:hypothetical protein